MNNSPLILVIDDEEDILEFLSYNLEKELYRTLTAPNGLKGLEMARQHKPDLIILDIMMPKLDGVEVCKMIREDIELNETLVLFLTAREEDFTQIAALEAGGDDFVNKPIRPRVLMSRVAALLRRKNRSVEEIGEQVLVAGELTINKTQMLVFYKGREIELPKKEFDLIWLFASKPGKVFKRDEIFNKVWGNDVIVGNRTIDVHIRKLRERIDEEIIKTVKGVGYKLEF